MTIQSLARKSALAAGCAVQALIFCAPAQATGTAAGTEIKNTATATYSLPSGGSGEVTSNTVSLTVDELLDVTVTWDDGGDVVVQPGLTGQVLTFTVTNTGNGSEAFELSARNTLSGDNFDPSAYTIYLDTNGDGNYDPGVDLAYVPGAGDPVIAADGAITVFVVATIPVGATDNSRAGIDLIAEAVTGTGAPGTTFADAGAGGGDAVVGLSGADGMDDGYYKVSAATVAFVKSQLVVDPFGGSATVPGSIITYTLVATVNGSGTLTALAIADAIPTGTTYVPGSLKLEGSALTDPVDSDRGEFAGSAIAVRPGDVLAGQSRTVTFQVMVDSGL